MAIIRDGQVIQWETLGRDKFLRNKDAPALFEDPVTLKDIRGGAEVISRSGNVMPRAITRDKLGTDALLVAMNLNVTAADVKQVATGYDKSLNDYIYVITWDGTNYALRRFNTLDLLSPYQDAFLLNASFGLAGSEAIANIFGVAVTNDRVVGSYETDAGNRYLAIWDFGLAFQSRVRAPFHELALTKGIAFDGANLVGLSVGASGNGIDSQQSLDNTQFDINSGGTQHQTFKTGANVTAITAFAVLMKANAGATATINWAIKSSDGGTTLASGNFSIDENKTWRTVSGLTVAVSANTTYRLELSHSGGTATENWFGHTANKYPDGVFSDVAMADAAFKIYAAIPGGYSGNRLIRYDPSTYALVDTVAWSGALPDLMATYDKKFHYASDSSNKKIVKFVRDASIVIASEQAIEETVKGVLHFNSFMYVCYTIGGTLVAVPVSI